MDLWDPIYRYYQINVFPKVRKFRGATRIKQFLLSKAYNEKLQQTKRGFTLNFRGVNITAFKRDHFQEILGGNPIRGYTLHRDIKKGDTVIDAGAYPGIFTIYAAKKAGPEGKVIALEPDKENMEAIKRNASLNDNINIEFYQLGLWNEEGSVSFIEEGLKNSRITEFNDREIESGGDIEVRPLDSLVEDEELDSLDFIKMDIEGAEIEAIKGARRTIEGFRPFIAVASYHQRGTSKTAERVESLLESYGMTTSTNYDRHLTTYGHPQES
ncbi:MAG: FkbM family methyltransferase [Candidatus Nanohaloarchaea archaeon]